MIIDFAGCYVVEKVCKTLFATLEPGEMVTRGRERREVRRAEEEQTKKLAAEVAAATGVEKKTQ